MPLGAEVSGVASGSAMVLAIGLVIGTERRLVHCMEGCRRLAGAGSACCRCRVSPLHRVGPRCGISRVRVAIV
ncbi:MAG: hypothetical protein ACK559_30590, partial [bacterium]